MYTGAMPGMTKGDLLGHEVCTSSLTLLRFAEFSGLELRSELTMGRRPGHDSSICRHALQG